MFLDQLLSVARLSTRVFPNTPAVEDAPEPTDAISEEKDELSEAHEGGDAVAAIGVVASCDESAEAGEEDVEEEDTEA